LKLLRILVLLAVGALLFKGGQAVQQSQSLRLEKFEVAGNTEARMSSETVVEAAGVHVGDHLLRISTKEVSARLEKLPWVASAKVERILPSTLRITVDEREASMVVQTGQGPFLVDAEGLVLQQGSDELVNLVGMPLGALAPGSRIGTPEFSHSARILRTLPAAIRRTVSSISAESIDQIQILTSGGPVIYYGAAEQMEEKNYAAQTLLDRTKAARAGVGVIDVRVPSKPVTRAR
jgi:cell division protein FtsQ